MQLSEGFNMNYYNYSPNLVDNEYEEAGQLETAREEATIDMLNTIAAGERLKLHGVWCDHDEIINERVIFTDEEVDAYIDEQKTEAFIDQHDRGC